MTDPIDEILKGLDELEAMATNANWVSPKANDDGTCQVYATHNGPCRECVPVANTMKPDGDFIAALRNAYPALRAEIERLKDWKQLGGEYADCLQKLCMDRLYPICEPISHGWPGRKHVDTIAEAVDLLLAEIERLRKIEAAARELRDSFKAAVESDGATDDFINGYDAYRDAVNKLIAILSPDGVTK